MGRRSVGTSPMSLTAGKKPRAASIAVPTASAASQRNSCAMERETVLMARMRSAAVSPHGFIDWTNVVALPLEVNGRHMLALTLNSLLFRSYYCCCCNSSWASCPHFHVSLQGSFSPLPRLIAVHLSKSAV